MNVKQHKTPLRYPGGKSRATKFLDNYFPHLGTMEEYYEPFLGGGSVALYVTKKYPHLKVRVNDLYYPLYEFWINLRDNADQLHRGIMKFRKKNDNPDKVKKNMEKVRNAIRSDDIDSIERSINFYILNKCSFGGLGLSGGFSKASSEKNFTINNIDSLLVYSEIISNWVITNHSYETLIKKAKADAFVYLDPPYDLKQDSALYGEKGNMHRSFDHDLFSKICNKSDARLLISYNNEKDIINRFDNWNRDTFDLTYTMRSVGDYGKNQKGRKELVLWNYDIIDYF